MTPRLFHLGPGPRPNVSVWAIQPDEASAAIPFDVVCGSTRARLLSWCTRGGIDAVTLGDTVLIAGHPSIALVAHEAVHVWQFYREAGGSLTLFVAGYLRRMGQGYRANAWEREAYELGPAIEQQFYADMVDNITRARVAVPE